MKATFGAINTAFFKLRVHWVFVSKYRRRVFNARAIDVLRSTFADVYSHVQATLVDIDGEDDHVHLLANSTET
jgi:putative transposase